MAIDYKRYKMAEVPLPEENLVWEMYGAGLDNFGKDGKPVAKPLPKPGPDELLVRTDAVGICFSDVKLTSQGPEHPRITGRDLIKEPVVPGHEASITVVAVGENLKRKFKPGERYIVQADVFYKGVSMAYGYVLPGAMQQYGIIGPEVLQGDEGCYLLPIKEDTGYVEAALAEPWACVVAAYRIGYRQGLKKGGYTWFYNAGGMDTDNLVTGEALGLETCPGTILTTNVTGELLGKLVIGCNNGESTFTKRDGISNSHFQGLVDEITGGKGFDDIVVLGTPTPEEARDLANCLGSGGILNIVAQEPIKGEVEIDIGRVHYDNITIVGSEGPDINLGYQATRDTELVPGGEVWFIGAAGPMGQMHVQRAVELELPPAKILCTDIDDERMEMLKLRVESTARERNIEILFANPTKMQPGELEKLIEEFTDGTGFDDIVSLVPVAALIAHSSHFLSEYGVLNIFAGVPRGTKADLPISDCFTKQVRYIGSSGSKLSDLADTLHLAEDGKLGTGHSAAAIGGMNAMREGIAAVKEGRFPGKTVIFPQFPDLPLMSLTEIKDKLPTVYAKLKNGMLWTKEAEEEFFRVMLGEQTPGAGSAPVSVRQKALDGKVAVITGAAQGLGEALARRMAEEGARVALLDLQEESVRQAAYRIADECGTETVFYKVDVTNESEVQTAIRSVLAKWGQLDIAVANAGILIAGAIENFEIEKWRKVIDVNLVGYFTLAKAAAQVMIPQGSGTIIQINSKSGKKGSFRNSAYAASKFGGIGLTQSLALELAPHGVRVNAICPGNLLDSPLWVDSLYEQYSKTQGISKEEVRQKYEGQVPLGRGCTYDDVANVLVFLASEQSSYMTGQAINVTGGQQMD